MPIITIANPCTYKCGSTWLFQLLRKQPDGTPVDLSGLATRAMFRAVSVDGDVIATLADGDGLEIDAETGTIKMTIDAITSAAVSPGVWVFFDVEMSSVFGYVWQSPTYRFRTEAEVTRD